MKIKGKYQFTITEEVYRKITGWDHVPEKDREIIGAHTTYVIESNSTVSTDDLLAYFEENNLKSAEVGHILVFPHADHPEVEFPLSSIWTAPHLVGSDGSQVYPVVRKTSDGRGLIIDCHPLNEPWEGTNRFLALPK